VFENEQFRIGTYLPVIDSLMTELNKRSAAYEEISMRFTFLTKLSHMNNQEIKKSCEVLAGFYQQDLDEHALASECEQFKHYISFSLPQTLEPTVAQIYMMIKNDKLESTFPNIQH
jgi:hypothetical protein